MTVLSRYVAQSIFTAILMVVLVLVTLNMLALMIEQVSAVGGGYTFLKMLQYVLWRVPSFMVNSLGLASLIGCLIGLGMLANNNELTVMRASGVSVMQIVWLVIRPVTLVIVIGMALGQLAPYTERQAEALRSLAIMETYGKPGKKMERFTQKKVWNREGNEFIRFDTVLPQGRVYGVTRYTFNDEKNLTRIQFARSGEFRGDHWELQQLTTTFFERDPTGLSIRQEEAPSLNWDTRLTPEMITYVSVDPENLTLQELKQYATFLSDQGRNGQRYELEFWKKALQPLVIISLVLMAMSFVFGSLRQVSMGQRVFFGVLVGIVFHTIQGIAGTSSLVFGFSPLMAVLTPLMLCSLVGMLFLLRVR